MINGVLSYVPDIKLTEFYENKTNYDDKINLLGTTGRIYSQGNYYGGYFGSSYEDIIAHFMIQAHDDHERVINDTYSYYQSTYTYYHSMSQQDYIDHVQLSEAEYIVTEAINQLKSSYNDMVNTMETKYQDAINAYNTFKIDTNLSHISTNSVTNAAVTTELDNYAFVTAKIGEKSADIYYGKSYILTQSSDIIPNITYIINTSGITVTLKPFDIENSISKFTIYTNNSLTFNDTINWNITPDYNAVNYTMLNITYIYSLGTYFGTYLNF